MDFLTFLIKAILLYFSGIALFMIADNDEKISGIFFFAFGIILIILSIVSLVCSIGSFILLLGGFL